MQKIRLYLQQNIVLSQKIIIKDADFEYLTKVMRVNVNDIIFIFDGLTGEYESKITIINKKNIEINVGKQIKAQSSLNNISLAFAIPKNIGIDIIAKKATEMGISCFHPIITDHAIVRELNSKRFNANIKEACEQCERNDIPELRAITKLEKFLESNFDNNIILCDETSQNKALQALSLIDKSQRNILMVGPEGGFSPREFEIFKKFNNIISISLGKNILRCDTAIVAGLAIINEVIL